MTAVRIKKNRPKGKIVLKKKDQTEKKNGTKKQKTATPNPVYLHVQATPRPLHHSDTHDLKI